MEQYEEALGILQKIIQENYDPNKDPSQQIKDIIEVLQQDEEVMQSQLGELITSVDEDQLVEMIMGENQESQNPQQETTQAPQDIQGQLQNPNQMGMPPTGQYQENQQLEQEIPVEQMAGDNQQVLPPQIQGDKYKKGGVSKPNRDKKVIVDLSDKFDSNFGK
jgi:hypothetical protein